MKHLLLTTIAAVLLVVLLTTAVSCRDIVPSLGMGGCH